MAKQKIEIEIEVPAGFEVTGERRPPNVGEYVLNQNRDAVQVELWHPDFRANRDAFILRKLDPEIRKGWINVFPKVFGAIDVVYASEKQANDCAATHRIACVEVTYEVPRKAAT